MRQLYSIWLLSRPLNLLFIILTQFLLWFFVYRNLYKSGDLDLVLNPLLFGLLSLSTVLITAAGYLINDYFDIKADEINRPHQIIIDRFIPRRKVMISHIILNVLGVLIGTYVAWQVGNLKLAFVHLCTWGLLWFYSTDYKKQTVLGNLVVALLTALVVCIVLMFETTVYRSLVHSDGEKAIVIMGFTLTYAAFAFFITLIREVIKDIEDVNGDRSIFANTIPIVWGIPKAKYIIQTLLFLLVAFVSAIAFKCVLEKLLLPVFIGAIGIIGPAIFLIFYIDTAEKTSHYKAASNTLKFMMMVGILLIIYFGKQLDSYFTLRDALNI